MIERLKKIPQEAGKYALPAIFLGIGTYALLQKEYFIAAAGGILGFFTWPRKEGQGAHMTARSSAGHLRVLDSSSSLTRISRAEAALPKAA